MMMPQASPKEWNTGRATMNLSSGLKSAMARICATFDKQGIVRVHDPLGLAFRAGREQHDGRILGLLQAGRARREKADARLIQSLSDSRAARFKSSR